jgi:SAM-dependent methyltransferase
MLSGLQLRLLNCIAPSLPATAAGDYVRRSSIESVLPGIADRVAGKVVIDFGCGDGADANHLSQLGAARVTGIDIQERWLARARQRALEAGLSEDRCAFATSTSEGAGVIVCLDSFEHFADPAEALRQMHPLLRPGGSLLLSFGWGWSHPRGGHSFSEVPWAHLLFSERALIQWRSRHKSDPRRAGGHPYRVLEPPGERRLARQQGHLLPLHAAVRALDPIHLNEDGRPELAPRQVPHGALADVTDLRELPATTATLDLAVAPFASHPQLQCLGFLVDRVAIDPVARPAQYPGELVVSWQLTSLYDRPDTPESGPLHEFLRRAEKGLAGTVSGGV